MIDRPFAHGEFHVVFLDSEGKPMNDFEYRIIAAAIHLAEAESRGSDRDIQAAINIIVQNARALVLEQRRPNTKDEPAT